MYGCRMGYRCMGVVWLDIIDVWLGYHRCMGVVWLDIIDVSYGWIS